MSGVEILDHLRIYVKEYDLTVFDGLCECVIFNGLNGTSSPFPSNFQFCFDILQKRIQNRKTRILSYVYHIRLDVAIQGVRRSYAETMESLSTISFPFLVLVCERQEF